MGQRYTISRDNITPVGGQDILTIITAASRRARLVEINITGQGASSAAQRLIASRSTGGTTPGGAIVPSKAEHSEQPAAVFTTATTWAAQPTPETNGIALGWNALGGANRWVATPGRPQGTTEARNGENISIRAPSGPTYQACSISVVIEED
jgi:hypothetical protein